jgi:hypothetical protein
MLCLTESKLQRCKLLIYASKWAAQNAIAHYQVDSSIIRIVPWGPNFECDHTLDDIKRIVNSRSTNCCKLLFFGRDLRNLTILETSIPL